MNMMHIDDFDLTQIRLLAELSRSRSVSRAAQGIGVSQSAASHALAKLRKKLADPLFTRGPDGFQPTPFGARLANASCEALEALLAGFAANDAFDPLTSTRTFTFFMNDVGQTVFLPPLLKFLKHNAPGISARVLPVPLDNPGAALASGAVDFAAGFFDNLTTGFLQRLIFHERYICIVRTGNPRFRVGMTVDAFKKAEHAVADATGMAHAVIDRFLARHRVARNVTLRVPGLHVLPIIVANSDLLAVVPSRLADAFAARVAIKVLPLPVALPPYDICLHWHERFHNDPGIRWMRRAFVDLFSGTRG
jgi:DNA-binding transcriptional LysR family regulator